MKVTPRGHGLRFAFTRRVRNPVRVDVYQTSKGRRVTANKRVVTFKNRAKGFTWNGSKGTDGLYVVRLKMKGRGGRPDVRRFTFGREDGVFAKRRPHYRRASCKLLQSFRLIKPGFGGTTDVPLRIQFRLDKQREGRDHRAAPGQRRRQALPGEDVCGGHPRPAWRSRPRSSRPATTSSGWSPSAASARCAPRWSRAGSRSDRKEMGVAWGVADRAGSVEALQAVAV